MHHLLSLKHHSSTFKVIPVRLMGSRSVCKVSADADNEDHVCTDNSPLDVYAYRHQYENAPAEMIMNFLQFATTFQIANHKLTKAARQCNS